MRPRGGGIRVPGLVSLSQCFSRPCTLSLGLLGLFHSRRGSRLKWHFPGGVPQNFGQLAHSSIDLLASIAGVR